VGLNFSNLWKKPQLGLDAIHDSLSPLPIVMQPNYQQRVPREPRGGQFWGEYTGIGYSTGMDRHFIPSLGREYLYVSSHAVWRTGGPHYPNDYGFGPGYHGDCMTPQFYMRPGIPPGTQALLTGGRQL
jgi:hypothetical protein